MLSPELQPFDDTLIDQLIVNARAGCGELAIQLGTSASTVLSQHPQVRFTAATTGAANLLVAVAAENLTGLYTFLTRTVGSLEDVRSVVVTPILDTVKRTGLIRPPQSSR